jgi:signal transduction histidine kinase
MMQASNHPTHEQDFGRLAVIDDHDRMARRLNAEVIHELFAVGLKLQALASQFDDVSIRTQLEDTIASTDKAIQAVRGMVFERTNPRDGPLERVMVEARRLR